MSLRLKTLRPSIAVKIQSTQQRKEFDNVFDGLIEVLPSFNDAVIETFIVDQVIKITSDFAKNPQRTMQQLVRLLEFCRLLVKSNIRTIKDLPVVKPLKQFFFEFTMQSEPVKTIATMPMIGSGNPEKPAGQDIDFQDPHVYLKEIEMLDATCLQDKAVKIKGLYDKLMAVIKLSLPLLDVAKAADKRAQHDAIKAAKSLSITAEIEGILDMITGEQARLHTRRIVKVTRLVHDVAGRIADAEHEKDSLQARHDKPWMFMITKEEQMPEEKFRERMEWLASEISTGKKKLNHVMSTFKNEPECKELADALEKLEKYVDINAIRAFNDVVVRIHAAGTSGLIVSKDDLNLAKRAGIKLDSILVTSDSPFPDLDEMNREYFNVKEKLYAMVTSITAKLTRRATEEKAIVENGIIAALLQIMREHEVSLKGNAGCGFLCMTSLVQHAELDFLGNLDREIDRLSMLVSERFADPQQIKSLVGCIGEKDVASIDAKVLEEKLKTGALPDSCIEPAMRLLKYAPLSRDAYYSPAVAAARERITGLAANLKVLDAIFMLLAEVGLKLEEIDVYLPRKFIAMEDARRPTDFGGTLDKWKEDNVGRMYASGGATQQKEVGKKIDAIKAKLENLEGLIMAIPDDVFEKVKTIPLPQVNDKS
nr:hypothetical protein [Candidatus Sigynarchaeota archaeon]